MNDSAFIAYYRVSTDQQGRSGLGLEAQRAAVAQFVAARGGSIITEFTEVESGRKSDRPELAKALTECRRRKVTLVIVKLDRLARNVAFIARLMDTGVPFRAVDMPTADRFMLHVYAAMAEEEARRTSARTKAALAAAKARGVVLGQNIGELVARQVADADAFAAKMVPIIGCLRAEGYATVRAITDELNRKNIPTAKGGVGISPPCIVCCVGLVVDLKRAARRFLRMAKRTVLVDNCVHVLAEVVEPASKAVTVPWGDRQETVNVVGVRGRRQQDGWKQGEIECLPTIVKLARENLLALYLYNEVHFESMMGSRFPGVPFGDLFKGLHFEYVDAAVERSWFFQTPFDSYIEREMVIEFCKFLLTQKLEERLGASAFMGRLPPQQAKNLLRLDRFRVICRNLSEKQLPDALHLWTAEVNGIEFFLTTDKKFVNALTQSSKVELPCLPVFPSDLLTILGVEEREPMPYEPGRFYYLWGQPG